MDLMNDAAALESEIEPERLVKSTERVRDLGEVFTPSKTVNEMLDLLPDFIWDTHPSPTFLEPACGDGNFLVAILERKLSSVLIAAANGLLPAGSTPEGVLFHGLEALSSIYAVDISPDNIIGGTPGHEIGARTRLLRQFWAWVETATGEILDDSHETARAAEWIISHNVLVGNMLDIDSDGKPSGRESLPIFEYSWEPSSLKLEVKRTTMGSVLAEADDGGLDIWGGPEKHWVGNHIEIFTARRLSPDGVASVAGI